MEITSKSYLSVLIADYDVGKPHGYDKKRPLYSSIKKLEEISKMENIELYILSISRMNEGISQKNSWIDKYAPFFKDKNRIIIAREDNNFEVSSKLKASYIKGLKRDESKIVIIDDDPEVIREIMSQNKDVILLKDTVLVD